MKINSYILYLETLVISLLDERGESDIKITDPKAPPFAAGFTAAPYNVRSEIAKQRALRLKVEEDEINKIELTNQELITLKDCKSHSPGTFIFRPKSCEKLVSKGLLSRVQIERLSSRTKLAYVVNDVGSKMLRQRGIK